MKTEDTLSRKKFPWKNTYNQGNILLVLMILGTLGGILTTYTFVFLSNYNREKERLQNDFSEKRLMVLAHLGYSALQAKASNNSVVPLIKEDVLHLFDTSVYPVKNLGQLDIRLDDDCGYRISADFDETSGCFPKFQESGVRLSLDEFMELDKGFIELSLKDIFDGKQCDFIKRRWLALKNEDKPLPLDLFYPLLTCLKLENKKFTLSFFNPYDRPLEGSINIEVSLIKTNGGASLTQNYNLSRLEVEGVKEVEFSYDSTLKFNIVKLVNSEGNLLIIKNSNCDQGTFNLCIPDKLTENFWNLNNDLGARSKGGSPWSRKGSQEVQVSSDFWREGSSDCDKNTIFMTKTWVEKLNACFFFYDGSPYEKIGNFASEKMKKLNDFVWNQCVADKNAESFNFNGPESYLRRRMKELLSHFLYEESIEDAICQIFEGQIFVDAVRFIEKVKTVPKLMPYLHVFKNLQARPDVFSIEAWIKGKNQKVNQVYTLNVMRKLIDSKPIWQKR